MAEQPRWVVWRSGPARKGSKPGKAPYNLLTGEPADSTDPATRGALAEAQRALRRGHSRTSKEGRRYLQRYSGVEIALGDGLAGVDEAEAAAIIAAVRP